MKTKIVLFFLCWSTKIINWNKSKTERKLIKWINLVQYNCLEIKSKKKKKKKKTKSEF